MGYYLCVECRLLFDDLVKSDKEPVCLSEPECRCATYECAKCFKAKLYEFGFFQSYRMKMEGLKSNDSCYSSEKCCVCQHTVTQQENNHCWMDVLVCSVSYYTYLPIFKYISKACQAVKRISRYRVSSYLGDVII